MQVVGRCHKHGMLYIRYATQPPMLAQPCTVQHVYMCICPQGCPNSQCCWALLLSRQLVYAVFTFCGRGRGADSGWFEEQALALWPCLIEPGGGGFWGLYGQHVPCRVPLVPVPWAP
jgi:hypothetical protein